MVFTLQFDSNKSANPGELADHVFSIFIDLCPLSTDLTCNCLMFLVGPSFKVRIGCL